MGGQIQKVLSFPITKTIINDTVEVTGSMLVSNTIESNIVKANEFSGSFSGSGRDLFDIPLSALATDVEQRTFIASGSVTASTDPEYGFKVNTTSSIEGDLNVTGGLYVSTSAIQLETLPITQSVTTNEIGFLINGNQTSSLKFLENVDYHFDLSDVSNLNNPIKLSKTLDGTHNGGVEYNNASVSTDGTAGNAGAYLKIEVDDSTPKKLYYYSVPSSSFGGNIKILKELPTISQNIVIGNTEITGGFDVGGVSSAEQLSSQFITSSYLTSSVVDFLTGE